MESRVQQMTEARSRFPSVLDDSQIFVTLAAAMRKQGLMVVVFVHF
jgi:hypothetical protein